ncbi:MAG: NfeD family protein [Spirochaetota bacterium]
MGFIPYIWLVLGVLLIFSEFFVPGFVVFFFGAGALINAVLTFILPGIRQNIVLQMFLWLLTSGISLLGLRKYFAKIFKGTVVDSATVDEAGEKAAVIEEITPEKPGRIKLHGTTWPAISYTESFKPGDCVEILKKENLTYIVTKSITDNEEEV